MGQQATPRNNAQRSNVALRLARYALREGATPSVRTARDAIVWCARQAEQHGDAGAAAEAARLAPYARSRAGGAA